MIRPYRIVTGPQTPAPPTAGTPTLSTDVLTKGYGDANYGGYGTNIQGTRASPIAVTAGGGIIPTASVRRQMMFVQGSGGAVDLSALNPQIVNSGATVGDELLLYFCSGTNTIKMADGNGLVKNGTDTYGADWTVRFIFNGTAWCEEGPK